MARLFSPEDHDRVTAAVTAAERTTDGEIVTIVSARSDGYADIAWLWAGLVMLLALAVIAAFPAFYLGLLDGVAGGWGETWSARGLLTALLVVLALKFLGTRLILAWLPLRMALTPGGTKARRVRRRAVEHFRVGTERRTGSRTGVLLYLSLAERRAEIVADAAIHARVAPETWGNAMAALVAGVRAGRGADGMVAAVEEIGHVLAAHFPRTGTDPNELPDKLIEL